uniref:Dirigent protein n=1 Tax=Setaria viridis TaxID=4556 RepID=A0A4U6TEB9_SETVI|nr:hypothetical protein SEVIR_8G071800v2 [Setaria viridis]
MYVHDWVLTTGLSATENVVVSSPSWSDHHQLVHCSRNSVPRWQIGSSFAGSTLEVSGITEVKPNGQWSITGGTVAFASAHGTIKFINSQSSTAADAIKELDIFMYSTLQRQR